MVVVCIGIINELDVEVFLAAILTLDGVGEWATASWGQGVDHQIELKGELRFPHSLGLLYSALTYYTGFRVNSGEYKVMGLAPYGHAKYKRDLLEKVVDLKEDGSFRLDMSYFNYCQGLTMTSEKFHDLFGGPPRQPETAVTQKEMDLARSVPGRLTAGGGVHGENEPAALSRGLYRRHRTHFGNECIDIRPARFLWEIVFFLCHRKQWGATTGSTV